MRPLPTPPAPGKPVSATLIRQLIDAIRERTILPGRNTSLKRGPNGTVVNSAKAESYSFSFSPPRHWTFSCTEDPDTHERTGGWKNCRLQIGLNCRVASNDVGLTNGNAITGTDLTDDGIHYVEVDLRSETAEIKVSTDGSYPRNDLEHDKVNVLIGIVEDGKLVGEPIDCIPVIYKYL